MKSSIGPLAICAAGLILMGFTSQDQISGREKPRINFDGALFDVQGNQYTIVNLTIGGEYHQIPVYQKPNDPEVDPAINTTRLDLAEVHTIEAFPKPKKGYPRFRSRDYIEIMVTSNDKERTKNHYIIDADRTIYCDQIDKTGKDTHSIVHLEKELEFSAIKKLRVDGYRYNDPEDDPGKKKPEGYERALRAAGRLEELVKKSEDAKKPVDPEELKIVAQEIKTALGKRKGVYVESGGKQAGYVV